MNYDVKLTCVSISYQIGEKYDAPDLTLIDHDLTPEQFRIKVMELQKNMKESGDSLQLLVTHHFAPGSYAREIFHPKGVVVIGKIHRHAHVNVISKGEVHVVSEFGTKRIKAPATFVSQPGTKRCVYALEDTVWTTIHATDETDLKKIEEEIIAPSYEELIMLEGGTS